MRHRGRRTGEEVVQQAAACVAGHHPPAVIEQRRLSTQSVAHRSQCRAVRPTVANRSAHSADGFRSFRATPVSPSVAAAAHECAWQRGTRPAARARVSRQGGWALVKLLRTAEL